MEPTKEAITEQFHNILSGLIALNLLRREIIPESTIKAIPVHHFTLEYCTVKCDIGRNIGKSQFVRKYAEPGDLVIVRKYSETYEYRVCQAKVATLDQVLSGTITEGRPPFKNIFVDEPMFLFQRQRDIDKMYLRLSRPLEVQTFIWLGC